MATHTPGPWAIEADAHHADVAFVKMSDGRRIAEAVDDDFDLGYLRIEDAHLIAAAPDLLAALRIAVETIRIWHHFGAPPGTQDDAAAVVWDLYQQSPEMRTITAAIAKAQGTS